MPRVDLELQQSVGAQDKQADHGGAQVEIKAGTSPQFKNMSVRHMALKKHHKLITTDLLAGKSP
ncbi:uncharacterized protein G2W53_041271 [Senna tora]|uniref:Uncharacterized protein n=1 Tax=Senna tora TaxID=362788 RepID=A0A834VZ14_9FABA|nr:uncharacterized protein G2W53_041271 [Senna tora]